MSREITIKNSRWFKKRLNYEDIIDGTSFVIDGQDEHDRRIDVDDSDAVMQIIYDSECIGRGVLIDVADNSKTVRLELPLPAPEADFRVLYTVARRIALQWGAKSILLDGEKVELTDLDECMEKDFAISTHFLSYFAEEAGDGALTLPCATLPICLNSQQLTNFSKDYKTFGQYLHERQSLYPFYSIAWYVGSIGPDTQNVVKYVAMPDGNFVLPNSPEMTYHDGENSIEYDQAVVATPNLFKEGEIAEVDFLQFLSHVPDDKKTEFDCEHTLIYPLSIEELQAIFSSQM